MNTWQITRQIRHLLKSATWTDSPNDAVFSGVYISDNSTFDLLDRADFRAPWCVVRSPSTTADRQNPLFQRLSITVDVMTIQENDAYGEAVIVGGNHTVTSGSSAGKGLAQIEQEVYNAIANLGRLSGVRHAAVMQSARGQAGGIDGGSWASRSYTIEVINYQEEFYPVVSGLSVSNSGGDAVLVWTDPPSRFDLLNIVVRRGTNTGDAAPTSVTGGTSVGTAALTAETITDTAPGSGTWNYSVFAAYDSSYAATPATATDYSAAVTTQLVI